MPQTNKSGNWLKVDKLGESLSAEVFLAHENDTDKLLLIKQIRPSFIVNGLKDHLQQQLQHLQRLDVPGLFMPELQTTGNKHLQLVQAYPQGQLLRAWLAERKSVDIKTVLEIAIALADCLVNRHRAAFVHKAIKPNNILIQEHPIRIQLLDEVQVLDSVLLSQFVNHPHYRRETLPYVAPEMSGRIHTTIDYYSDLYSVGIVLYECLIGEPPFLSDDPLSIIHSHLAEQPQSVSQLDIRCPVILSDIINTLLCKQPDKRYQSADGLRADLQRCLASLENNEGHSEQLLPVFTLRQHEAGAQITIPSIMVGRDKEQQQLLDAYQRVCEGELGLVTVSGLSGIGKTRLIQELEIPIVTRHGYFSSGKFNQFSSHVPYSTLVNALSCLVRQILSEDGQRLAYWRERMLSAVGVGGQLLINIVPDVEKIIGQQPAVQSLPAKDARSRFNGIFSRFIACLASEQHPLVLFIDDMQWCDEATFDLLEFFCAQPLNHRYILIIGAYRSNEVGQNHRLIQMQKKLDRSSQSLLEIQLAPLDITATNQIVAYILNAKPFRTEELTERIYSVTGGNPLYISEGLRWLHKNKRIYLSAEGRWSWAEDTIYGLDIPDNLTSIFVAKMAGFTAESRDLLATAALLGAHFKAQDLADITQRTIEQLLALLSDIFSQRILQSDKAHWYFFHDQIQAAAVSFLDAEQQFDRHRSIARTYIERCAAILKEKPDAILPTALLFSIVEHLSAGKIERASIEKRTEAAGYYYRAGIAALTSLALDACLHYLQQCSALCSEDTWKSDYDFMFALHKNLARAALINGDQQKANKIVDTAFLFLRNDLDRADILYEQAIATATLGDLPQAIVAGTQALALLGEGIPTSETDIQKEITETQGRLHSDDRDIWQEVLAMPPVEGRVDVLTHQLYGEMVGFFYFSGRIDLTRLLALRSVEHSVNKGLSEFTCYAMANMGYCLYLDRLYPLTKKYEAATLELVKRYTNTFGAVKAMVSLEWATLHLSHSVGDLRAYCHENSLSGIMCGELRYGGFAQCMEHWYRFIQGDNILLLDQENTRNMHLFKDANLISPLTISEAINLTLRPLLKSEYDNADSALATKKIKQWCQSDEFIALAVYYTFSGVLAYYNHQYVKSQRLLNHAQPFLLAVSTTVVEELWFVFKYLLSLQDGLQPGEERYLERVKLYASQGVIFTPYMGLVTAEKARYSGDYKIIRNAYLDAIDCAHKENYVLLEAFLNGRLYQYLRKAHHHTCEVYHQQANQLYERCGVRNRVADESLALNSLENEKIKSKGAPHVVIGHDIDEELDTQFLFEAVATITSELDQDKLLGLILESVMARLGAITGYLLIVDGAELKPTIKGLKDQDLRLIYHHEKAFNTDKLCMSISNYVLNTREKVVLEKAIDVGEFTADEAVQRDQLRSVLCVPLTMQQQILGVLYFENNLIDGVFTDTQISHADVLIAQGAVALQNARLLNDSIAAKIVIEEMNRDLETTIKERTKELQIKQLELSHAARLASIGELATGIAHELGQPLQIIQVASRIVQDELESEDFDKTELMPFIDDIHEQIQRATSIISNMRIYARNDDDNKAVATDLTGPFNQSLVFFNEQFHQHKIELTIDIEDKLPQVVVVPQKFQQIVVNLLSNARHAVDKKSAGSDKAYSKEVDARLYCNKNARTMVLEIADNGIGMSQKVVEKCLNPFYTTKDVGEGTGLGLSIVIGLIEEFDFSLEIDSKENEGSLFRVVMPISPVNTPSNVPHKKMGVVL